MRIGIMSAVIEENQLLIEKMEVSSQVSRAKREYTIGTWLGHEVVVTFSRWGKVAAAITATHLITEFQVDAIIFTGVAGACAPDVDVGDIVIAESLFQHDMDARPIFSRYEIPLTGQSSFSTDPQWASLSCGAAKTFLNGSFSLLPRKELDFFHISSPQIHQGSIASGDKFFASKTELLDLEQRLPGILCVEMEGAAVAQVCDEYGIPYTVIRTISDSGNENSPEFFREFVTSIASHYSLGILEQILPRIDYLDHEETPVESLSR